MEKGEAYVVDIKGKSFSSVRLLEDGSKMRCFMSSMDKVLYMKMSGDADVSSV